MAVLVEAISVVIRLEVVESKYPGGWESFVNDAPNETLCADDKLARIGFMSPDDVKSYVDHLERLGFVYIRDGHAIDLVVADQQRGFPVECEWAAIRRGPINDNADQVVSGCQAIDSETELLISPDGWTFEGSLSQTFGFSPTETVDKSLKFLRHENGCDVYFSLLTGKEVYIGRTGER